MSIVCGGTGGAVTVFTPTAGALTITVGTDTVDLGVVVGLSCSREILVQIQNAFDRRFYVTPFGNSPGKLEVTVLSGSCGNEDQGGNGSLDPRDFYEQARYRGGTPLAFSVGGMYAGPAILAGLREKAQASGQVGPGIKTSTLAFALLERL